MPHRYLLTSPLVSPRFNPPSSFIYHIVPNCFPSTSNHFYIFTHQSPPPPFLPRRNQSLLLETSARLALAQFTIYFHDFFLPSTSFLITYHFHYRRLPSCLALLTACFISSPPFSPSLPAISSRHHNHSSSPLAFVDRCP